MLNYNYYIGEKRAPSSGGWSLQATRGKANRRGRAFTSRDSYWDMRGAGVIATRMAYLLIIRRTAENH